MFLCQHLLNSVERVFKDRPISHKNVVSQDRSSNGDMSCNFTEMLDFLPELRDFLRH